MDGLFADITTVEERAERCTTDVCDAWHVVRYAAAAMALVLGDTAEDRVDWFGVNAGDALDDMLRQLLHRCMFLGIVWMRTHYTDRMVMNMVDDIIEEYSQPSTYDQFTQSALQERLAEVLQRSIPAPPTRYTSASVVALLGEPDWQTSPMKLMDDNMFFRDIRDHPLWERTAMWEAVRGSGGAVVPYVPHIVMSPILCQYMHRVRLVQILLSVAVDGVREIATDLVRQTPGIVIGAARSKASAVDAYAQWFERCALSHPSCTAEDVDAVRTLAIHCDNTILDALACAVHDCSPECMHILGNLCRDARYELARASLVRVLHQHLCCIAHIVDQAAEPRISHGQLLDMCSRQTRASEWTQDALKPTECNAYQWLQALNAHRRNIGLQIAEHMVYDVPLSMEALLNRALLVHRQCAVLLTAEDRAVPQQLLFIERNKNNQILLVHAWLAAAEPSCVIAVRSYCMYSGDSGGGGGGGAVVGGSSQRAHALRESAAKELTQHVRENTPSRLRIMPFCAHGFAPSRRIDNQARNLITTHAARVLINGPAKEAALAKSGLGPRTTTIS